MDYLPILSEQSVFKDDVASRRGMGHRTDCLKRRDSMEYFVSGVVFDCGHLLKADC